jgi:hypothetical protein
VLDISYLKSNEFKTLIDIGANNGENDEFLKNLFNIKRVLAFEPQNDKPAVLTAKRFNTNELEDSWTAERLITTKVAVLPYIILHLNANVQQT